MTFLVGCPADLVIFFSSVMLWVMIRMRLCCRVRGGIAAMGSAIFVMLDA